MRRLPVRFVIPQLHGVSQACFEHPHKACVFDVPLEAAADIVVASDYNALESSDFNNDVMKMKSQSCTEHRVLDFLKRLTTFFTFKY